MPTSISFSSKISCLDEEKAVTIFFKKACSDEIKFRNEKVKMHKSIHLG